jgi:hypothetical protein
LLPVQARATLTARRKELLAELNFARQVKDSVQSMRTFLSGQATGGAVEREDRALPQIAQRGASGQERRYRSMMHGVW